MSKFTVTIVYSIVIEVIFTFPAVVDPILTPITSVPVPVPGTIQLNASRSGVFGADSVTLVRPINTPS